MKLLFAVTLLLAPALSFGTVLGPEEQTSKQQEKLPEQSQEKADPGEAESGSLPYADSSYTKPYLEPYGVAYGSPVGGDASKDTNEEPQEKSLKKSEELRQNRAQNGPMEKVQ